MCWSSVALPVKINFGDMTKSVRVRFYAAIRKELSKNLALQPGIRRYNAVVVKISELTKALL